MARGKVKVTRRGVNAALSGPLVVAELQRLADSVAARARASAPVDTGEYRASIRTEINKDWVRPRARIIADAPHARAVEAATGNLARALGSE